MAPAQQGNQTLAISPSLIVGIVILAAFALVIIIASVCRFCCGDGPRKGKNRSASIQYEGAANGGIDVFNPNRPRSAEQLARMQQVRWINNMYAWERGRQARMEIGELKPDDAHLGHNRNWGDWSSIGDNSSGSASGSRSRGQVSVGFCPAPIARAWSLCCKNESFLESTECVSLATGPACLKGLYASFCPGHKDRRAPFFVAKNMH